MNSLNYLIKKNNSNKKNNKHEKKTTYCEDNACFLSRITFAWFAPLILRCINHDITRENIGSLPKKLKPSVAWSNFNIIYESLTKNGKEELSIIKLLFRMIGHFKLFLFCLNFILEILLKTSLPWIAKSLVELVSNQSIEKKRNESLKLVGLVILFAFLSEFLEAQHIYAYNKVGLQIYAGYKEAVIRKLLSINYIATHQVNEGEIMSFLSAQFKHTIKGSIEHLIVLLCAPFSIFFPIIVIYTMIGFPVFVATSVIILSLPVTFILSKMRYSLFSLKRLLYEDRTTFITEILDNLRELKMSNLESMVEEKVHEYRAKEVNILVKYLYLSVVLINAIPRNTIHLFQMLCLFVYIWTGNLFYSSVIFSVIQYCEHLNATFLKISKSINSLSDLKSITKRFESFFQLPNQPNNEGFKTNIVPLKEEDEFSHEVTIYFHKANFIWEIYSNRNADKNVIKESGKITNIGFMLQNVNLYILKSQKVAVIGNQNSGKSSLLYAISQQMKCLKGNWFIGSELAMCPQKIYIFNHSIKFNILCGYKFNNELYNKVIKMCGLKNLLASLPYGDNTIIEDNSDVLSISQQICIQLARTIYSSKDIILIDIEFSLIQSTLRAYIIDQLLQYEEKTIIFTFSKWHPNFDRFNQVILLYDGIVVEQGKAWDNDYQKLYYKYIDSPIAFWRNINENESIKMFDQNSEKLTFSFENETFKKKTLHPFQSYIFTNNLKQKSETHSISKQISLDDFFYKKHPQNEEHKKKHLVLSPSMIKRQRAESSDRFNDSQLDIIGLKALKNRGTTGLSVIHMPYFYDAINNNKNPTKIKNHKSEFWRNTILLIHNGKLLYFLLSLFFLFISKGTPLGARFLLGEYIRSSNANESDSIKWLHMYGIFQTLPILCIVLSNILKVKAFNRVWMNIHNKLITRIMNGSLDDIFGKFSIGFFLNIFIKGVSSVDLEIPDVFYKFWDNMFEFIISVGAIVIFSNWITSIVMITTSLIYFGCFYIFLITRSKLQSTVEVSQNKTYQITHDVYKSSKMIRCIQQNRTFIKIYEKALASEIDWEYYVSNILPSFQAIVIAFLNSLILTAVILFVLLHGFNDIGNAGLVITYSLSFKFFSRSLLNSSIKLFEKNITFSKIKSVLNEIKSEDPQNCKSDTILDDLTKKRKNIENFDNQESIQDIENSSKRLDQLAISSASWPSKGYITIHNLFVSFATRPFALRAVSMRIDSAEKIGIIGRTNSGKSSIFSAILRIIKPTSGEILIDGIDINQVPLKKLRSNIAVVHALPFIFKGSLRYNLDPLNEYSDDYIKEILCELKLNYLIASLDTIIDEEINQVRVCELHLISFIRAILKNPPIVLIDDISASINLESEKYLMKYAKKFFKKQHNSNNNTLFRGKYQ